MKAVRTTKKAVLVEKLARPWLRGAASRRGDLIVLNEKQAVAYDLLSEPRVGWDLMKVRTPEDALWFATKYGLLTRSAAEPKNPDEPPIEMSQHFAHFERAASDLRDIARLSHNIRNAAAKDADSMASLRTRFGPRDPEAIIVWQFTTGPRAMKAKDDPTARAEDFAPMDDRAVILRASEMLALALSDGLAQSRARPYVFDPAMFSTNVTPGRLRLGILPETLLGFCYLTLAEGLAKERFEECEECQVPFVIEDERQRFCTKACAGRARFRRFQEKQKHQRGGRHGKTTGKG